LRNRPELFGQEAVCFLDELQCAASIDLSTSVGDNFHTARRIERTDRHAQSSGITSILIGDSSHKKITLSYVPFEDTSSKFTALTFEKVINQILSIAQSDSVLNDKNIEWPSDEHAPTSTGVVVACDAMHNVLRTVKQIAATDVSVLVTGETGTGKEVIARTIHEHSLRARMPFLAVNCAAVPRDLLESQLFGYKKGAFSGASDNYQGLVRAANGGSLFLDEIGDIPLDTQAKLLRFLDLSEVHPIGEPHPIKVNVRLIFATNGDLEQAVAQNRFRQDLFYRLNVIPLKIPPLRERKEEIPVLVNSFVKRFATELSKEPIQLSTEAMERLIVYSWPGNVRQLANEIRRLAVLKESGAFIVHTDLSTALQGPGDVGTRRGLNDSDPHVTVGINQSLETAASLLEREMIKHALKQSSGRVSTAAAMLGISRKGLYLKRLRLGLADLNDTQPTPNRTALPHSRYLIRANDR
jgi:transcriptional regulator with PAS, ATPase and Fis domain